MGRSLVLTYDNNDGVIQIPANGTDSAPISITVKVDNIENNASFNVYPLYGEWFTYEVERDCTTVKILIKAGKNLSTDIRLGRLVVEHNCSQKLTKYVGIEQSGMEYSLEAKYGEDRNGYWVFKSVPSEVYEEKRISLTAHNGRGKWYLKEIQQYQTLDDDEFTTDKTTQYDKSKDSLMSQIRVPYDGAFSHHIDGNDLVIKSFGRIDLLPKNENAHMRYFFVFCHMDVNNTNKDILDDKGIEYEQKKLFLFDQNDADGYNQ